MLAPTLGSSASADQAPLKEQSGSTVGYASVAEALKDISQKPGIQLNIENGWLIAVDEKAYTVWSFAPKDYPAYPAVVKRYAVPLPVGSRITMAVLCEASKAACDELVRTFARMNGFALPE